jgi:hypothetical protein
MYFGKTIKKDVLNYKGSGIYWKQHLKEHGNNVDTIWISKPFLNKNDLEEFATFFSEEFDIVNSEKWANLVPENGIMGGNIRTGAILSEDSKNKIRNSRIGKKASDATRKKMSDSRKGKNYNTKENIDRLIKYNKERKVPNKLRNLGIIICQYCNHQGPFLVMHRYHMERCKHKDTKEN